MGHVYAEIELINVEDMLLARRHLLDKDEVRSIRVRAMVDTGAVTMAINENIQEYLQLPVVDKKRYKLADGQTLLCDLVFPLEVRFKNRVARCTAIVLPEDSEPLIGVIPLEEMDVIILPLQEELVVNPEHPDYAVGKLKGMPRGVSVGLHYEDTTMVNRKGS